MAHRDPNDPRCKDCSETRLDGRSRCAACQEARRLVELKRAKARRKAKLCVTCGHPAAKDRRYCAKHLRYYAARMAAAS